MELSGNFVTLIDSISLRAALQEILLNGLAATGIVEPLTIANFPLSHLGDRSGVSYTSAIAPMIAAKLSLNSVVLAQQLAQALPLCLQRQPPLDQAEPAIAPHINISSTAQGWLTVFLTAPGVTVWLEHVNALNLAQVAPPRLPSGPDTVWLDQFPLCDRLHVSLPLLLAWAYTRCQTLLSHAELETSPEPVPAIPGVLPPSLPLNTQLDEIPDVGGDLLKALIRAVDTIAKHAKSRRAIGRQGYQVAEAIYAFDAGMSIMAVDRLPSRQQLRIRQTLTAAQQILALILVGLSLAVPPKSL
jgi:hypothetical protein